MATRFAGDVFSKPLEVSEKRKGSVLTEYFPEFTDFSKALGESNQGEGKATGGFTAVQPFAGFKPMKKTEEKQVGTEFAGYKPMGY